MVAEVIAIASVSNELHPRHHIAKNATRNRPNRTEAPCNMDLIYPVWRPTVMNSEKDSLTELRIQNYNNRTHRHQHRPLPREVRAHRLLRLQPSRRVCPIVSLLRSSKLFARAKLLRTLTLLVISAIYALLKKREFTALSSRQDINS